MGRGMNVRWTLIQKDCAACRSGAILLSASTMDNLIERNLAEITRLCREYRVRRLAIFGSILRPDFDPQRSDADFLVEFEPVPLAVRTKNYLGLRTALSSLLGRSVDLVEEGAIRNPYILKNVAAQRQVLYAA